MKQINNKETMEPLTKEQVIEILKRHSMNGVFAKGERALMITEPSFDSIASELCPEPDKSGKSAEEFPDIDFRRDIAEELTRSELIDRLCEMNETYRAMRKGWLESQSKLPTDEKPSKRCKTTFWV